MAVEDVAPENLRHSEFKSENLGGNGAEHFFQDKLVPGEDSYFKPAMGLDRYGQRYPIDRQAGMDQDMSGFHHTILGHNEVDQMSAEEISPRRGGVSPLRSRRPAGIFQEETDPLDPSSGGVSILRDAPFAKVAQNPFLQRGASALDLGRGVSPLRGTSPAKREDRLAQAEMRGEMHAWEAGRREGDPQEAVFEVSDKVTYWSDTHRQRMLATVVKKNFNDNGVVVSYDLDVKRNAQASKMRHAPHDPQELGVPAAKPEDNGVGRREVPTPMGCTSVGLAQGPASRIAGVDAAQEEVASDDAAAMGDRLPETTPERFEVGDKVEYWSDTYKQWMQAQVQRVRDDGFTYDLDVKKGAQFRKMRLAPSGASQGSSAKAAEDVVPAQTFKPASLSKQQPSVVKASGPSTSEQADVAPAASLAPGQLAPMLQPAGGESAQPSLAAHAIEQFEQYGVSKASSTSGGAASTLPSSNPSRPGHSPTAATQASAKRWTPTVPGSKSSSFVTATSPTAKATPPIPPPLAPGMKVKLEGLKAAPHHNGMLGALQSLDEASGRWTVRLADGEIKSVKANNIIVQDPSPRHLALQQPMEIAPNPVAPVVPAAMAIPQAQSQPAAPIQQYGQPATPPLPQQATPPVAAQASPSLPVKSRQANPINGAAGSWVMSSPAAVSPTAAATPQVGMVTPHAASVAPKAFRAVHATTPAHAKVPAVKSVEPCLRPATLEADELQMGQPTFDPSLPSLHAQLTAKLKVSKNSSIEALQGFKGGLNEGVWIVSDPVSSSPDFVLKLVRCHRIAPTVLTEAENFMEIAKNYPSIMHDPSIAFPVKIFACFAPDGVKKHDLITMHRCPGSRFAEVIATKWYGKQLPALMTLFERLGACLREYHNHYGNCQHGDFQPSNVFCDEETGRICLIDCGGMGVPTMETDVEHFSKSIRLLSDAYGPNLLQDGIRHFEEGYRGKR
mmetsp:Transcript_17338/g.40412  ORF Transcript_17338/g.40412 Transcript_17338/m.40412 type:complete len:956 (+) Transcript_17338:96-2963(+)